ncbi:DUF418 domain-containing protein [Nocardia terpenica]|uniref:DUF418 domain-containing protein n=1 Tax=Nocardia terpenica TaxID=455432 RepID=A0A164P1X5_9NOCA|nr:DUF418 domain-containing protein [Nocardia terpenica]KZM75013.1 hypothetical protein AWN90_23730 [Nocardia terpenica]NQE93313.1 DUF418 domain-containing protein [Nocardia terpenica]
MEKRIVDIDVVRGFAVAGLPVVNLGLTVGKTHYPTAGPLASVIYDDLFLHRFVTIFTFLFGVSFALVLHGASERAARPRLVLVRRLVALIAFGVFQLFLLDGNLQLFIYAVLGLVVLLPVSYLPRPAMPTIAVVLLLFSLPFAGEGLGVGAAVKLVSISMALLVLGASVVAYGIHADLPRRGPEIRTVFLIAAPLAVVTNVLNHGATTVFGSVIDELAMLSTSVAYVTGLLLLLRTRARRPLVAVLSPLGRMALTNFLVQAAAATVFAAVVVDIRDWNYVAITFGLTILFVAVQSVLCTLWLRRFRYGPFEWLWRCATWLTVVPIGSTPTLSSEGTPS